MKKTVYLLFMLGLILAVNHQIEAQDSETKKQKIEQERLQQMDEEAKFLSPVRYVIVYDEIFELSSSERRVELIVDKAQFNEKNLIKIFELVKKRFPLPLNLEIEVHTNLATIETPEEREKTDDSTGRLTDKTFFHKTASFSRFGSGRQAFIYAVSLSPYKTKTVVLVDEKP